MSADDARWAASGITGAVRIKNKKKNNKWNFVPQRRRDEEAARWRDRREGKNYGKRGDKQELGGGSICEVRRGCRVVVQFRARVLPQ